MSAKRTSWNEFSSSMALAVIYLSTGRKINFSKYIFDSFVRNVDSSLKFYMYDSAKQADDVADEVDADVDVDDVPLLILNPLHHYHHLLLHHYHKNYLPHYKLCMYMHHNQPLRGLG
uniref:Uncharacterized protein n=1 Tax=Tanacetum cinerariifolium TaxID=118510 RepID=A0A6L2MB69_TANCI|nr:hypothetical protein [Tanacetum cinerariifolium]